MNANAYNLNQGQKEAADAFFEFLFDREAKGFIISGPAGVGKTYWMGYIIDIIMPRLLAGQPVSASDIAALGHGGLCRRCEVCVFPNCSFGKGGY